MPGAFFALIVAVALRGHVRFVLRPQILELKRKLNLPVFQGTGHYQTIQFTCERIQRQARRLGAISWILGVVSVLFLLSRYFRSAS